MENEQNQNLNTTPPPPAPQQPIVEPEKTSLLSSKWLKIGAAVVVIIFVLSLTFVLGKNSKNNPTQISPTPTPHDQTGNPNLSPSEPKVDVTSNWKNETVSIEEDNNAMYGNFTLNIDLKIPSDWKMTVNKASGCTSAQITNGSGFSMSLNLVCNGWGAKYSDWPRDAVIALQQKRMITSGEITRYRIRIPDLDGKYNYVDADDKNKMMDAILIGYPPPNEATHDFYFTAANLTVNDGSQADLTTADKIAASITINSLVQK